MRLLSKPYTSMAMKLDAETAQLLEGLLDIHLLPRKLFPIVNAEGGNIVADDTDVLLKFIEEEGAQARQSEEQRATITNLIIVIASAVIGLVAQKGLNFDTLPLTILLIPLGIYGAIVSSKLYERFRFHMSRVHTWRERVDEINPNVQLLKFMKEADSWHKKGRGRTYKLRLNHLWLTLHMSIAVAGIVLCLVIVLQ